MSHVRNDELHNWDMKSAQENARAQSDRDLAYSPDAYCECPSLRAEEEFAWGECCVCGKAIRP